MVAAHTTHGRYSAAGAAERTEQRHIRMFVARTRLLCRATLLQDYLPPDMAMRLARDPPELWAPKHPTQVAFEAAAATTPCNVKMGVPGVGRRAGRALGHAHTGKGPAKRKTPSWWDAERGLALAEAEALAPWKAAVAFARAAKRGMRRARAADTAPGAHGGMQPVAGANPLNREASASVVGMPAAANMTLAGLGGPVGADATLAGLGVPAGADATLAKLGVPVGADATPAGLGVPVGADEIRPGLGLAQLLVVEARHGEINPIHRELALRAAGLRTSPPSPAARSATRLGRLAPPGLARAEKRGLRGAWHDPMRGPSDGARSAGGVGCRPRSAGVTPTKAAGLGGTTLGKGWTVMKLRAHLAVRFGVAVPLGRYAPRAVPTGGADRFREGTEINPLYREDGRCSG